MTPFGRGVMDEAGAAHRWAFDALQAADPNLPDGAGPGNLHGPLVGFYMQLHVGWGISNFYRAEHDPLSTDLLIAEGHRIQGGTCSLPEVPGFGLKVNEERFRDARIRFDLKQER